MLEPGDYVIKVGSSSRDTRLERTIQVQSEHEFSTAFLDSDRPKISEGKLLVDDQTFSSMLGGPFRVPIAASVSLKLIPRRDGETFLGIWLKSKSPRPLKSRWALIRLTPPKNVSGNGERYAVALFSAFQWWQARF